MACLQHLLYTALIPRMCCKNFDTMSTGVGSFNCRLFNDWNSGPVFSYKLRYIVGFWLVEMAISTNQKSTIYRNLYENTGPGLSKQAALSTAPVPPPNVTDALKIFCQRHGDLYFLHMISW